MENASPTPPRRSPANRPAAPAPAENPALEAFVHATLRALPPRPAPRSLEDRVFAALAAREALPWWKKSYAHWPHAAQLAFFLLSAAIAAAVLWAGLRWLPTLGASAVEPAAGTLGWLPTVRDAFALLFGMVRDATAGISPFWLYGALACVGVVYAALMGLGAAAYRYLWQSR